MNYPKDLVVIKDIIKQALKEDIGKGDITTGLTIGKDIKIEAVIIAKENGTVCGMDIAKLVFKSRDNNTRFFALVKDGDRINKGKVLAKIYGLVSSILSSERVALNFLGFLSGIATHTQQFVKRTKPYNVKIMDTRKTLPALRGLEKYAVKIGGGWNHRFRLDGMIMIKDNHIKIMNSKSQILNPRRIPKLKSIIEQIKKNTSKSIKTEIEVKNLREFKEALEAKPDIIMLDNMTVQKVKRAVQLKKEYISITNYSSPKLEVSGNINLGNIRAYAATGIDFISLGTITKDIQSLDLSLEVK